MSERDQIILLAPPLRVDQAEQSVLLEDQRIHLTGKAFAVLCALMERAERLVSKDELVDLVWDGRPLSDSVVTTAIKEMRQALGDSARKPRFVETVHGKGYRFKLSVALVSQADDVSRDALENGPDSSPTQRPVGKWPIRWILKFAVVASISVLVAMLAYEVLGPDRQVRYEAGEGRRLTPAIAVLPFLNLSAEPSDAFIADGTAETLTHVLARVEGLKVVARSSAFAFRAAEDVRTIGDALEVDVVLEGSVQVLGDVMRITTQLVDTRDGSHLWSAAYDHPVEELFAVQDSIAGDVAAALQLTLLQEGRDPAPSPEHFEAYREYLLGLDRMQERTAQSILAAETHFSEARQLDERYALAHVGYAEAISLQHYYLNRPIAEVKALALPALERALDLDGRLGEAYAALGFIRFNDGDISGAEAAMKRAVALSPNYARAWFGYGTIYNDTGKPAQALQMHLRALELNPLAPHINNAVAVAHEKLGDFAAAMDQFERTIEIAPDYGAALYRLAALTWSVAGDAENAIRLYKRAFSVDPSSPWAPTMLSRLYLDLGDDVQAEKWVGFAEEAGTGAAVGELKALLMLRKEATAEQRLSIVSKHFDDTAQFGFTSRFLRISRDAYLELNDPDSAVALTRKVHPELFRIPPEVSWVNFSAAVDLAYVFKTLGKQVEMTALLNAVDVYIQGIPRLGCCGFGIADVEIALMRGNHEAALSKLQEAVAQGWKVDWWLDTTYNPNLTPLAGDPRLVEILAPLKQRIAAYYAEPAID